jgi:L-rhamnose mutarotase
MYMKTNFVLAVLVFLTLISCKEHKKSNEAQIKSENKEVATTPKRFGMVTGIKPDKIEYYKKLHANAWPAVLKKIKECNIQNYSIYIQKMEGKYFLFSYFEYVGADFDGDMKKMAADSNTQKWWKETDPTQIPLPEAASKKQTWTNMEEVFHAN